MATLISFAKRLFITTLLLCVTQSVYAQHLRTLYGKIISIQTHEPLPGARVTTKDNKLGAVADSNGFYSLQLTEGYKEVFVKCLGYDPQRIPLAPTSDSLRLDIRLHPSDNRLSEVMVIGHNEARKLRESAMPVSVITAKQLQGTTSSVNDILARTAGVTIRSTGGVGSASRISLRGLEGKRMGTFIDEAPMGGFNNYVSLNDVPVDMIERVEIYKGIVPYKFGGSALGGAVNIVTQEYPPVYLDAGYEVASFNTHRVNTVLKRTHKPSGLQLGIGGTFTHSDNDYKMRLANLDDRIVVRDHDKYDKLIIGGSAQATKWWFDELKMELIYMKTRQELQGIETDIREAYNHSQSALFAFLLKKDNFFVPGLDLDFDLGYTAGLFGLSDQAMHIYDWDGKQYAPVSPLGGEEGSFPSDGQNRSSDLIAKLNLGYTIDAHQAINLNLLGMYTHQSPKDELMDRALGFSANFPSHMQSVVTGLSYDLSLWDDRFQSATTLKNFYFASHSKSIENYVINRPQEVHVSKNYWGWSEALRYRFTPRWLVKASFSSEVRIPTNEELIGNGYSILPSPSLTPEYNRGFNLGTLYHYNHGYGFIEAETNIFYNRLDDMIRFTADMIPTMARYRNFGSVRTYGIEAEVKGDFLPWLYAYVNATYQDLRDVRELVPGTEVDNPTKGMRMPNIPYLMANAGIELHKENLFGGRGQQSRFLVDASYVHNYFYDFEMSAYQERKIPTSLVIDAALEHTLQNNRWTIGIKVKNLTNREVYSEFNRPLPRRSFALKLRYLFK